MVHWHCTTLDRIQTRLSSKFSRVEVKIRVNVRDLSTTTTSYKYSDWVTTSVGWDDVLM